VPQLQKALERSMQVLLHTSWPGKYVPPPLRGSEHAAQFATHFRSASSAPALQVAVETSGEPTQFTGVPAQPAQSDTQVFVASHGKKRRFVASE